MYLNYFFLGKLVVAESHNKLFIVSKGHSDDKSQRVYSKTTSWGGQKGTEYERSLRGYSQPKADTVRFDSRTQCLRSDRVTEMDYFDFHKSTCPRDSSSFAELSAHVPQKRSTVWRFFVVTM